jgi:lysophospholipase L1-like esterase
MNNGKGLGEERVGVTVKPRVIRREQVFGLLTILLSAAVVLGLAELGVRVFIPRSQWVFLDATDDWRPDPELGWTNRYSYRVESVPTESGAVISFVTNADGILHTESVRTKAPGVFRVMLFGDSAVVGRAVADPERIHNQLQKLLTKDLRVEVLNAGVQGYSTDQSLLLMRRLVPIYKPDLVIYALCDNDFEGNQWAENYGNQKPKCTAVDETLNGCTPPSHPDQLRIRRFGSEGIAYAVQHSALYRFFRPEIFALRMRFMKTHMAQTMLPPETYEGSSISSIPGFNLFKALLVEMQRTAKNESAEFIFYSHPALQEVWDPSVQYLQTHGYPRFDRYWLEHNLADAAAQKGIRYCPLIDYFRSQQGRGPFHLLPRDPHCNATGYAVTAERLYQCIRPLITNPERGS